MTNANDPRIKNIPIISANTEYSYHFSANTKRIMLQARGNNALHIAFDKNQAVSGVYQTLKAGGIYFEEGINAGPRFYLSGTAGDVVEILFWL